MTPIVIIKTISCFSSFLQDNVHKKYAHTFFFQTFLMWACFRHRLKDVKVVVVHLHGEISCWNASRSFGTLLNVWVGSRDKSKNQKLDIACKHLARRQRASSTSTRVQEVDQGVTIKGFGSGSKQIVELFQLHKNPQNIHSGLKE